MVNFNTSGIYHAVDQHALHVVMDIEESPEVPPAWDQMWSNIVNQSWAATNSLARTLGMTWPDYSSPAFDSPGDTLLITIYPNEVQNELRTTVIYHTYAAPAYTNYASASPADRARMDAAVAAEADAYIEAHRDQASERRTKRLADVTTHEMGHGLGIRHHNPTQAGELECVMRYFNWDFPRNLNDRLELTARSPWPNTFCRSANHTANLRGCWYQIKVSDQ